MTQDEFYENIPEWISQDKSRWNHITLMAYFCHKYKEVNGVRFRLVRWKGDPGKGKESRDFSRLIKVLAPEKYESLPKEEKKKVKSNVVLKIYNYINWMFDYKFRRGDRSVTGTQIFLMPSMINEFERMYAKYIRINNGKAKMKALLDWSKDNVPDIFNLHQVEEVNDVKMVKKYCEFYNLSNDSIECLFLDKAKELELI